MCRGNEPCKCAVFFEENVLVYYGFFVNLLSSCHYANSLTYRVSVELNVLMKLSTKFGHL